MERLRSQGLPVCRPDIAPMKERVCELHEAYNLNLALHQMEHAEAGPTSSPTMSRWGTTAGFVF